MTARNDASAAQVNAADPRKSTWLGANAGSGKTRVLTDRVARLLLEDVQPQHILCLTYTKAAASEMQNRLFQRLGAWAMLPEDRLKTALRDLGFEGTLDDTILQKARTLFARAIETPGGLKIQTIHSFCSGLLRRFPLEAGVSPQFTEMEDRAAALLREEIVEQMAGDADSALVLDIARLTSDPDFEKLTKEIVGQRDAFPDGITRTDVLSLFGLPPDAKPQDSLGIAFDGSEPDLAQRVADVSVGQADMYQTFAGFLTGLDLETPTLETLNSLFGELLYQGDSKKAGYKAWDSKAGRFPQRNHTKVIKAYKPVQPDLDAFMDRVAAAKQFQLALAAADRTLALHRFAHRFLQRYAEAKALRGLLDFDDLILKARDLLNDRDVAAWVLFRLDGGIDHILVDEAQDTSPAQWDVVQKLAQEFTSGVGARPDLDRTIFVVGDKKQSIYSFQGADPGAFDRMRDLFGTRFEEAKLPFASLGLNYSFRSSHAILSLVDATLSDQPGAGFPGDMRHLAFKDAKPGRVDIWPVIAPVEKPEKANWEDPVDMLQESHHGVLLARRIADEIKRMIDTRVPIMDDGADGTPFVRPVTAGDFLILVQRRSRTFHEIIRACKDAGLPMAGADRLKVGGEMAVKDIAAVLSFLAMPEDDLSLAVALRSPLFGLSEQDLFTLAHGRGRAYLWQVLRGRRDAFPQVVDILLDLLSQADFLRPYDLIERLLTRHDGRRKLLGRLGAEAEDGIDALLSQALAYESNAVPSLTGFLVWMETDDLEIKRQMDSAGDRVRVMTVHGAKGLEAPIVILPDTADRQPPRTPGVLPVHGRATWPAPADEAPELQRRAVESTRRASMEERQRLLYVAMTRAESWLIVAAAGTTKSEDCWYGMIEAGARRAGAVEHAFDFGDGLRLAHGDWPSAAPAVGMVPPVEARLEDLPGHFTRPAPEPAPADAPLSPSDLGGAKALPGETDLDEETRTLRGTVIHRLLEVLPARDPGEDATELAWRIVEMERGALADDVCAGLVAEALAVLDTPALLQVFAPDTLAEVPVTGVVEALGGCRVFGVIDRLIVGPDRVLAVDFKSNTRVPATAQDTPEGLLRQMGAYQALLQQVYPDRRIDMAILWTADASLMPLPHELVSMALARAARLDAG